MEKEKNHKKTSVIDNIILGIFILAVFVVVSVAYFSTNYINHYVEVLQGYIEEKMLADLRVIESMATIEQLESYKTVEDMEREDYKRLVRNLQDYASENNLVYAYYMRIVGDKVQYIADGDPNPETKLGLDVFEDPYWLVTEAYEKGKPVVNMIGDYQDGWDGMISAYAPIKDDLGNIVAIVGVDISDEDIVERRDSTQRYVYLSILSASLLGAASLIFILRYRKKARAASVANVAKSEFLSRMSHEIRTPMNAIIGFCRMAKNSEDIIKKNEYIDSICSSSDYLLELINDILDLSKIEASKMSLQLEKVNLYKTLQNIEIILASQIVKKNQTFKLDIASDVPRYFNCDETKITQVLVNLTGNSIKFTSDGGKIDIKVSLIERTGNMCNLEFIVQDNGIGIEEKKLSKLFEAFEQADGSITRKYGGTGLGLSISKKFVEMMKGNISVTSKVGEGSAFKFNIYLEALPDEENLGNDFSLPKLANEEKGNVDCTGMTFLIAEDNEINQIIVKDLFESFGAMVEVVNNGIECVEKFEQNPDKYEIIFMDIQMPEMDGIEATTKIRLNESIKVAKTIPIIAMTAEVFQEDIKKCLDAGMNTHLGKPINVDDVSSAIREVLKDSI